MHRGFQRGLSVVAVWIVAVLVGATVSVAQVGDLRVVLRPMTSGLVSPVGLVSAGDGTGRMFVVEQRGTVRVIAGGVVQPGFFLDLRSVTLGGGEQGLLGLAFHPNYRTNGRLFVHYTTPGGNTRLAAMRVSSNPNRVDPGSRTTLLGVPQPFGNHNGGQLAFGPDGMLYMGLGDGGSGGDPGNNAQNRGNLLGTILRLDVDSATPYAIPPDNPFVGQAGMRGEIWAYGLRNPWRFSFDRANGDLYVGDVGQNRWEEINRLPASSAGGANLGWRITEGPDCFNPASGCTRTGLTEPILSYDHSLGGSVTGGFRYRGNRFPSLRGVYLYGDFVSGRLWGAVPTTNGWQSAVLLETGRGLSAFGENEAGELFVLDYFGGSLLRIVVMGDDDGGGGGGGCTLPNGHPRFCADCGPCAAGQGDCDRDDECRSGLRCADNVGADFGFAPGIDVCVNASAPSPPTGCTSQPGDPQYCTACAPCASGQGDCDRDSECASGLVCTDNVGAQFGYAPGIDVCLAPPGGPPAGCPHPPGHPKYCTVCGPCRSGEGDCDSNAECRAGLVCVDNIGPVFGFGPAIDVCVAP